MGLIDKISPKPKKAEGLSIEEAEFILAKLRLATYKGEEFEMFYYSPLVIVTFKRA